MKKCLLALVLVLGLAAAAEATGPVFVPARVFVPGRVFQRRVLVPVDARAPVLTPAAPVFAPRPVFLGFDRFGNPVFSR